MPRELHIWELSQKLWDRIRSEADIDGYWTGSLSSIFREWDERGNQSRVTRALRLMGRTEIVKPGRSNTPTVLRLRNPELPLSIEEYYAHANEIHESEGRQRKISEDISRQRLDDVVNMVGDLAIEVASLERRLEQLEQERFGG